MPVVRRGDVYHIDVVTGQQFAEIDVFFAVGVFVVLIGAGLASIALRRPHIADGDILDVAAAEESALIAATHVADADAGHDDAIAGRGPLVVAECGRGNDIRRGHGHAGRFQKGAAGGFRGDTHRYDLLG